MNKLVSKNPVLRFKEGNKIRKMLNASGGPLWGNNTINYQSYFDDDGMLNYSWPVYNIKGASGVVTNDAILRYNNTPNIIEIGTTPGMSIEELREVSKPTGTTNEEATSSKSKTVVNPTSFSPKSTKRWNGTFRGIAPSGKVMTKGSNLSSVITEDLKNQLKSTGFFSDEDFKDVRSFQNALKLFMSKEGWESGDGLKIDNIWGNLTLKAFETALLKSKQPIFSIDGALYINDKGTPILDKEFIRKNIIPSLVDLSIKNRTRFNIEPNIPKLPIVKQPSGYQIITPQHPYSTLNLKNALGKNNNFQGLVDLIWGDYANDDNNFNAVFSRDMKNMFSKYKDKQSWLDNLNAIEKALNISGNYRGKRAGDYGDLFRALAKYGGLNNYMNGYRQGGQLVSRNPVKRFKNKK